MQYLNNIFLLLALVYSSSGISQNLKTLDEKNGFREMQFGDSISKFPNFKEFTYYNYLNFRIHDGILKDSFLYYRNDSDKLSIGGATVSLFHVFYKGLFYCTIIKTYDEKELLSAFETNYGNGVGENPTSPEFKKYHKYLWLGKNTTIVYNHRSLISLIYSTKLHQQILSDEKEAERLLKIKEKNDAIKAKDDF